MFLKVDGVSKTYPHPKGDVRVLDGISFELKKNKILGIIGPSGCGKSTLLKIIAGLETQTSGTVKSAMQSPKIIIVWQDHFLYPWRTVRKNISLGLEIQKYAPERIEKMLTNYIEMTGLQGFGDFFPDELSVGMKQRVALARALAVNPDVLLLDEPFSSVDFQMKCVLIRELRKIQKATKIPMIYVSHDTRDISSISDDILVLSRRPAKITNVMNDCTKANPNLIERRLRKTLFGKAGVDRRL